MGDILFLAHRIPFPPNRGDKIRAHHLLKKLTEFAPVHVGCFAENDEDRAGKVELASLAQSHCVPNRTKPLVLAGAEAMVSGKPVSLTAFHSPALQAWVSDTIARHPIETIVVFSGQMGQYVPADFTGRVVIDLCDVDSAKFEGYAAAGQRAWLNAREGRLLKIEEDRLARRADATILISQNEAKLFESRLQSPSTANVQAIGNGIDATFFDPSKIGPHPELDSATGPHFVFTGQMDYPPNVEAVSWAARNFMPRIRELRPDAQFHIVGRNPAKQVQSLDGICGVKVWGEVPDVRPFLAAADCVLAPLQIARGVQNKVLEAMAMARPVMLSLQAATGIAAQDGEHWLLCDVDADAMCHRMDALLDDRDAQRRIGANARKFVLDQHDWDARLTPLKPLVSGSAQEEAKHVA